MRNARLAEYILSLIMPSERAAAAIGDLLELSRTILGFWASVLWTFVFTTWQTLAQHPIVTAGMLARIYGGFLKRIVLFYIPFLIFVLIWGATIHRFVADTIFNWLDWIPAIVEVVGSSLVVPVLLSRSLMRQHADRGIAATLVFSSCILLLQFSLWIWGGTFTVLSEIQMSYWTLIFPPPALAVLLIASIVQRHKQLRRGEIA